MHAHTHTYTEPEKVTINLPTFFLFRHAKPYRIRLHTYFIAQRWKQGEGWVFTTVQRNTSVTESCMAKRCSFFFPCCKYLSKCAIYSVSIAYTHVRSATLTIPDWFTCATSIVQEVGPMICILPNLKWAWFEFFSHLNFPSSTPWNSFH